MIIYDNQEYNSVDDIPDFGSLVCISTEINESDKKFIKSYSGHLDDFDKLPTYDNLSTGSTASLLSTAGLSVFQYEASTQEWYEL